ncbi:amino acid permease [bacterium]|nr:amino acid permease [bacterium]
MKLKKELNLLYVIAITSGAMLSYGLFILPSLVYARAGPSILLSYILASLLTIPGMLSQAELASAMPKSGGTYFYVTRTMGAAVGTVYGLITLLALALKSTFALIGMAVFTKLLIDLDIHIISVTLCLVFILINIFGVKEVGRIQVFLVFSILSGLLIYFIRGLPTVKIQLFEPFAPYGLNAVLSSAGLVFITYGGLLKIASVAEEIKNPGRLLPLGMCLSLLLVTIFYSLAIFVTIGVLEPQSLSNSAAPISDAAFLFMGRWGKFLLSITAILGFISAANAGILGASRYPYALSKDKLMPSFLSHVNEKFKTPHNAIIITGAIMLAALFLNLNLMIKAASAVFIVTYIFSCFALIIMRESHLQNYRPNFHAPLYPWLQFIGIIGYAALLYGIGYEAIIINVILIACGFFVYWFYGRIRVAREFALLHLIERITAKELTNHSLETELKEIIKERDDIIKDRFDNVIENSFVLDIQESLPMENFFKLVAEFLSGHLKIEPEILFKFLIYREKESSTVISPGLAIPHIILDGEKNFDILIARCKEGIFFSEDAPKVQAIFVLIGTKDERNFHLRALSAIAQIVLDSHFEKRWMSAKSKEALRDIILLGKRKR